MVLWTLLNSLRGVERWKGHLHPEGATPENVVDHTFETDTLTSLVVMMEQRAGTTDVNFVDLLLLSHLHDNPEGGTGDVNYFVKRDPRIAAIFKVIEKELFDSLLNQYLPPELVSEIQRIMSLEKGTSKTSRLFDAVEKVGFLSFALYEVAEHRRKSYFEVIRNNYQPVADYAKEFPYSIGLIWQGMKPLTDELLATELK